MIKKATIVIDMINGFTREGALYDPNIENLTPKIANFLAKKPDNKDIFFVCDAHSEYDLEMQVYPIHCLKGTYESEIDNQLQEFVLEQNIVYKTTTNGFWDFPVKKLQKYDAIEVVGCCTDICILQFCLTLKTFFNKLGDDIKIIVYSDLVDTFDSPTHNREKMHNNALELIKNAGIEVV